MRQHQRAGITEMFTYRRVHVIQLTFGHDARRQDLGAVCCQCQRL